MGEAAARIWRVTCLHAEDMRMHLAAANDSVHNFALLTCTRRGYDVIDFAKQGALSVKGMELVPEAVSSVKVADPS